MEVTAQETRAPYVDDIGSGLLPRDQGLTDMRKTIILAVATAFLAGVSVVTGLARTHSPIGETISARPVVHPLTTGSLTVRVVPAT